MPLAEGLMTKKLQVRSCCVIHLSVKAHEGVWDPWEFRRHPISPLIELCIGPYLYHDI